MRNLFILITFLCGYTLLFGQTTLGSKAEISLQQADSLIKAKAWNEAIFMLKNLVNNPAAQLSQKEKADIFFRLHKIYRQPEMGQVDSVVYFLEKEIPLLTADSLLVRRYMTLGINYLHLSQLGKADSMYKEALKRIEYLDTAADSLRIFSKIGYIAGVQGDYETHLLNVEKMSTIAERSKDKRALGMAALDRMNYYWIAQDYETFDKILPEVKPVINASGDSTLINTSSYIFSAHYRYEGFLDSAAYYLNRSMAYSQNLSPFRKSLNLTQLAAIQKEQGKYEAAKITAHEAIGGLTKLGMTNSDHIAYAYTILGTIYEAAQDWNEAIRYWGLSYEIQKENDDLAAQATSLNALVNLNNRQNNSTETIAYLEALMVVKDSMASQLNREQVSEIETRMGLTIKEKELEAKNLQIKQQKNRQNWYLLLIGFLGFLLVGGVWVYRKIAKDKQTIAEQKELVEQSLQEKEFLLKEIHHRVKNNLQIISSLLDKQARNSADNALKKMMREGQDRIQSMALIHQNLYESDDLSGIEIKNYIHELTQNISSAHHSPDQKIDVEINADDSKLDIDTAIPLGLILNELLTNSFKHAFKNKSNGQIKIEFNERNGNEYDLKVEDDGTGFRKDVTPEKSKSLGLNLVRGLVRQLDGNLQFSSSEKGTIYSINF